MTGAFAFRTACGHPRRPGARAATKTAFSFAPKSGCGQSPTAWAATAAATSRAAAVVAALETLAPSVSGAELLAEFERQDRASQRRPARAGARARRGRHRHDAGRPAWSTAPISPCVWCGDSRAYLLRGGELSQVSRDHSEVQELIDRGLLRKEEAKTWPRRNIVTRALGARMTPNWKSWTDRATPAIGSCCAATD